MNSCRLLLLAAIIFFVNSCTKQDAVQQSAVAVQSSSLAADLYESEEYANYVIATRLVIQSIDWSRIAEAKPEKANALINKETFTKAEAAKILSYLPIDQAQYFKQENIRLQSIKSFQAKHHLSNEQSMAVWNEVYKNHQEDFTKKLFVNPIDALFCVIDAVNVFIETSQFCLTLRDIPFIGEELYQACQLGALTLLATTVQECIGISIWP